MKDKVILITGGTGSFGQWFTKEIIKQKPKEIRIFSRDEEKQLEMQRNYSNKLTYIIGDVRDYDRVFQSTQGVDYIFHAAALKIVPVGEVHPLEVIKTNIIGSENVKKAAIANGVEKSILISTDKAVKPINLYGMTKAIAEKIWIQNEFNKKSLFSVVRYGNVIGSRGSIIPYFIELKKQKRPFPITDINMTRFLITLQQAIELVFYATEHMKGGEIFVPKINAFKIIDLVRVIGGDNYPFEIVGIRPGEKIHECLLQEDEYRNVEENNLYYIVHKYGTYKSGYNFMEYTSENANKLNDVEIKNLLKNSGWIN